MDSSGGTGKEAPKPPPNSWLYPAFRRLRDRPRWLKTLSDWAEIADKEPEPGDEVPDGKDEKPKEKPERDDVRVSVRPWGTDVAVDLPDDAPEAPKDDAEKKKTGGSSLGSGILKVAGTAAAGITATGAIVAVGGAVLWFRFSEAGIPAVQAISVQPRYEALVQGAESTLTFLAIALVAVLVIFFFDPGGKIRLITVLGLGVLFLAAAAYVLCWTDLTGRPVAVLLGVLLLLFLGCVVVGDRTHSDFWPLALAAFLSALIFSAACGVLIVKDQRFVQAVAVLGGEGDAGLTGFYVAATDETVYVAQPAPLPGDDDPEDPDDDDDPVKRAIVDVPREGAAYAVGPLEAIEDAEERERELLELLIANRERAGAVQAPAPEASGPTGATGPSAEGGSTGTTGATGASGPSGAAGAAGGEAKAPAADSIEAVAKAFGSPIRVRTKVRKPWDCLVRYTSAAKPKLGRWWTSCREAEKLEAEGMSMFEIRDALALPGRFQPVYDMRVRAVLRPGAEVLHLTGPIAPQCEHAAPRACGYEYPGGSKQIYLPEPRRVDSFAWQCSDTGQADLPVWKDC